MESKTIDSRLQLAKEREKRETHYIRDVTVSLTAKYSGMKRIGDFGNGAVSLVVFYVVLSPESGLFHFTYSDLLISKRKRPETRKPRSSHVPMQPASPKVLLRLTSALKTPPDISLIRDFRIPSHFHLSSYSVFNLSNFVMLLFIY